MNRHDTDFGRFYEIEENVFYKSYTTVLSCMPASPWFIKWLKEHTKEEADELLYDAGMMGTKCHHAIDLVNRGQVVSAIGITDEQIKILGLAEAELVEYLKRPFTKDEDRKMRGYLNWHAEYKPIVYAQEMIVWDDNVKCAGTLDFLGTIEMKKVTGRGKTKKEKKYRETVIIDWKTGKNLYESYNRQTSGYFYAVLNMIKKKILLPTWKPKRVFLLQLGVNKCGYKFQEVGDIKKAFKSFKRTNEEWEEQNPNASPRNEYQMLTEYKV